MSQLHRTTGILDIDLISHGKIIIVGLGSLGSLTLANLSYPFSEIVMIDPNKLEDKNVERHLLGPGDIGIPKVHGCRKWLQSRGVYPKKITTHVGVVQDILGQHTNANLVILCVDKQDAKYYVNEFCVKHKIPLIVGGVYPLGDGGEVITITNFENTCLRCVEHQLGRDRYQGKIVDYGVGSESLINANGDLKAVPALRGPISEIAALISSIALDILQLRDVSNHLLIKAKSWTPTIVVSDRSLLKILAEYINIQDRIGLVPNYRLSSLEGELQLAVRDCTLSMKVIRWEGCPEHQKVVSFDDI